MPRNVIAAVTLPANPDRLFDMYLNPEAHAAFTGAPVSIAPRAGAPFAAFGNILTGVILHVQPKHLIVQTWRSTNFPAHAIDSVLVLTFWPEAQGARIEMNHINVPEEDFAGVSQGWEKFYWTPWRAYLDNNPGD